VVHGTGGAIGKQICSAGFAALSSLDLGYYGKGIYFTSSCLYATPYFGIKKDPAILLCFIIPGNVRPIVEDKNEPNSYLGVPVDSGYQSHYVLTTRTGFPITQDSEKYYDEFVLASDPQVVPVFLIMIDQSIIPGLIHQFNRDVPTNEKEFKQSRKESGRTRPIPVREIEIDKSIEDSSDSTQTPTREKSLLEEE